MIVHEPSAGIDHPLWMDLERPDNVEEVLIGS